jgi:pyrimidine deaminase RibD-like protein
MGDAGGQRAMNRAVGRAREVVQHSQQAEAVACVVVSDDWLFEEIRSCVTSAWARYDRITNHLHIFSSE